MSDKKLTNQIGHMRVSLWLIESGDEEILQKLFSVFYPRSVQEEWPYTLHYVGYSPLFDEITNLKEGEQYPSYNFEFDLKEGTIKAIRL